MTDIEREALCNEIDFLPQCRQEREAGLRNYTDESDKRGLHQPYEASRLSNSIPSAKKYVNEEDYKELEERYAS